MCRIVGFIDFNLNNSCSLEGREPFLDHKIVEWTSQLPVEFKYKNGVSKYLLRKVLYKYIPKELVERPKQGFGVLIYEWFKGELKGLYKQYLSLERIKRKDYLTTFIFIHR
jgi:asparagine synthase (glutamine-hydrolysing)